MKKDWKIGLLERPDTEEVIQEELVVTEEMKQRIIRLIRSSVSQVQSKK